MSTPDRFDSPDGPSQPDRSRGSGEPESMWDEECASCLSRAPELALGVLCGRERAESLLHLQRCGRCQDSVCELAVTVERLVDLVPEVEPPSGFESRVLSAILPAWNTPAATPTTSVPHRDWVNRRALVAAGACVLLGTAGVLVDAASTTPRPNPPLTIASPPITRTADVIVAPLISEAPESRLDTLRESQAGRHALSQPLPQLGAGGGREIGKAWIHPESPEWVYISMTDTDASPGPRGPLAATQDRHDGAGPADTDEPVTCTLIPVTGGVINLGTFTLHNGHADWVTSTTIDARTLAQAQLTVQHGHTLARATFTSAQAGKDADRDKDGDDAKSGTKDDSKDGTKDDSKSDSKDKGSRDDENGDGKRKTKGADGVAEDHKQGTDGRRESKQSSGTRRTHGTDKIGDLRDRVTTQLGDHSLTGGGHDKRAHGGTRHPAASTSGGHSGDHEQHTSVGHGSVSVTTQN